MRKLTKEQLAQRENLQEAVDKAYDALTAAIGAANEKLLLLHDKYQDECGAVIDALDTHVVAYNAAIADAKEFVGDITSDMQTYYDERSESWQYDDRGQAYAAWKQDWENYAPDEIDVVGNVDYGAAIDIEIPDAPDKLDELSEEFE